MIPAQAVEAAARKHFERGESFWDDMAPDAKAEAMEDMRAALEAAVPYMLANETAPGMSREEVHADLERVRAVRDSFDPGSTVWLVNQSMSIAYESVLGITDDGVAK